MLHKPSLTIIGLLATATLLITAVLTIAIILPITPEPAALVIDPLSQIVLSGDRETTLELTGAGLDPSLQAWLAAEVSDRQTITSSLFTYGLPQQLVIRNHLAYIANGPSGVLVVDISDRRSPTALGSVKLPGTAVRLDIQETLMLVASGTTGLQLLDLTDATTPRQLSTLATVEPALAVVSQNDLAFVACGKNGLQVIDLRERLHPRRFATLKLPGPALNLARHNNTLIVTLGEDLGIAIIDISVPSHPRQIAQLRLVGYTGNSLAFHDDHALVAVFNSANGSRSGSLYAIDLTIPTQPRITSVVPVDGRPINLTWSDRRATLSLGVNGLRNFDLSDPARPRLESSFFPPGSIFFATLNNDTIWATDTRGILNGINLNHRTMPIQSAGMPDLTPTAPTLICNDRLYLADKTLGLAIFDVADQNYPVLLGTLPVTGIIRTMVLHQKSIFLGVENDDRSGSLLIVDLTSLANPQLLATRSFRQIPMTIGMIDNTLALGVTNAPLLATDQSENWKAIDTLKFVDVAIPSEPRIVYEYSLNMAASSFALDADHRLSLISEEGLFQIIDLHNPLHPTLLGKLEMPWIEQSAWGTQRSTILFHNKIALVPTSVDEIRLIDLEDPFHPTELGSIATGGLIISMTLTDNLLLASIKQRGVLLIDLQRRLQPQLIGVLPLPGLSQRVTVGRKSLWYSLETGTGVFSARMPQRLEAAPTNERERVQVKIPTMALEEGDYSLWFSTRENQTEQPAVIRYRKG